MDGNVKMEVKGHVLLLAVDLRQMEGISKSGKTQIIASTRGAASVPSHDDVKVNLNVYKYPTEK